MGKPKSRCRPHTLVVNIPLTDFTEANGATEVWLGSHRETRRLEVGGDGYEEMLAEHRKRDRVLQATAKERLADHPGHASLPWRHAQPHGTSCAR